ncbi:hypothetical protein Dsin_029547 [Dipteronia sinensis]|uniref:Uncharacterized protein n=1 Tax=Dipteronia sinensis TaxID=43782 RepID=A0AAE0DVL1_9ROSI|nr:hypothetical protein Dsin_029547 [Dipteronia sinensis]
MSVSGYKDVMIEVNRKEKEAGIVPDPDVDTYVKYGDMNKEIMIFGEQKKFSSFLQHYYGYQNDHLCLVAVVLIAFPIPSCFCISFCLLLWQIEFPKELNFEKKKRKKKKITTRCSNRINSVVV